MQLPLLVCCCFAALGVASPIFDGRAAAIQSTSSQSQSDQLAMHQLGRESPSSSSSSSSSSHLMVIQKRGLGDMARNQWSKGSGSVEPDEEQHQDAYPAAPEQDPSPRHAADAHVVAPGERRLQRCVVAMLRPEGTNPRLGHDIRVTSLSRPASRLTVGYQWFEYEKQTGRYHEKLSTEIINPWYAYCVQLQNQADAQARTKAAEKEAAKKANGDGNLFMQVADQAAQHLGPAQNPAYAPGKSSGVQPGVGIRRPR